MMAGIVLTGFALCHWADPVVTSGPMKALPSLIPLGMAAGYLGWAGYKRLCDLISVLLWAVVVTILSGPIIQIAGSTSFPLVDDSLKQFDVVSTGEIVRWLQAHRAWWWISATAYWSMLPLLIAGMILPAIFRQRLAAYTGSSWQERWPTFITASTFARFPAAGPWTVEHLPADDRAAASVLAVGETQGAQRLWGDWRLMPSYRSRKLSHNSGDSLYVRVVFHPLDAVACRSIGSGASACQPSRPAGITGLM